VKDKRCDNPHEWVDPTLQETTIQIPSKKYAVHVPAETEQRYFLCPFNKDASMFFKINTFMDFKTQK